MSEPRHISSFQGPFKTAANLATSPLEKDNYHQAITAAARYLVGSGRGEAVYETQHANRTTVWLYQGNSITVPLQSLTEYEDPYKA